MANLTEPVEIMVEFLRGKLSDPRGTNVRVAESTSSQNGTGSKKSFSLTYQAQAINSVTVGGVLQKKYRDYQVDLRSNDVIFTTAPASGTNNVVIVYNTGASGAGATSGANWIHRDRARGTENWNTDAFPKIVVTEITESGSPLGIGDDSQWNKAVFQIDLLSIKGQKLTIGGETREGQPVADYLGRRIVELFKDGAHREAIGEKLVHPVISQRPLPFDESKNTFRRMLEVSMDGENMGF